jgi:hypothetical protein
MNNLDNAIAEVRAVREADEAAIMAKKLTTEKKLSEITRTEWIVSQWIEVTEMQHEERKFLKCRDRAPSEASRAAEEWDFLESVKKGAV